jgi:hypothetical protein
VSAQAVRELLRDPAIFPGLPDDLDEDAELGLDSLGLVWFLHQLDLRFGLMAEPDEERLAAPGRAPAGPVRQRGLRRREHRTRPGADVITAMADASAPPVPGFIESAFSPPVYHAVRRPGSWPNAPRCPGRLVAAPGREG